MRICRQDSRRHRIPRRSRPHRKIETAFNPRHLPGFLPSSSWTKNSRSSARASARHSQSRFCGIALLGNLLRLRRCLQHHANGNILRTTRGQNAPRPIHSRTNHRHRQPRLPVAASRRRRHPPHQPGGPPRRRTPGSKHSTMKTRNARLHTRCVPLLRYFFTSSLSSSPETAAPFPQRWGLLRKGRTVFRREDRSGDKFKRRAAVAARS